MATRVALPTRCGGDRPRSAQGTVASARRHVRVGCSGLASALAQAQPGTHGWQIPPPLTPELTEILTREREMRDDHDGWIFASPRPGASGTGYRDRMSKPFRRAVIRAGLNSAVVTPHVMRHTAITKLVKAGVDLATIQRISGHKSVEMVLRYTHVHDRHIDEAIKAIGRGLPEPIANGLASTITRGLHTRQHRTNTAATKKPLKP